MLQDSLAFWRLMDYYNGFIGVEEERVLLNQCEAGRDQIDIEILNTGVLNVPESLKQPSSSSLVYKFGAESFERDIPAIDADIALEHLKQKHNDALKELYKQLYNQIHLGDKLMYLIRHTVIKMATEEDSKFKLERFEVLHSALVQVVANQFRKILKCFDDWFGEFISSMNEKPLLHCVYYRKDEIRCKLYWSHPNEIRRYPHMILDKFYQCVRENLTRAPPLSIPKWVNISLLQESCKTDRLRCFEDIIKTTEVREAVKEFARKVQSEFEAIRQN